MESEERAEAGQIGDLRRVRYHWLIFFFFFRKTPWLCNLKQSEKEEENRLPGRTRGLDSISF